ncbi:hypothetical protein BJ170DRAFT_716721 [Xylariales sp. AK1849]|nr:hypothetical protein BJ170DRAFT_716721 [Xylariales sp. AK1849]
MALYDVRGKFAIVTGDGSVVIADLKLRTEAEAAYEKFPHPAKEATIPSAIDSLWEKALGTSSRIDILVNGAGLFEPPSSSFWKPPGISHDAEDLISEKGSTVIHGNVLWVANMGSYLHSIQAPLYFASKAAVVSLVKSLQSLKQLVGIRNSAVCPGAVLTPIYESEYARDKVTSGDMALTAQECAEVIMGVLQNPKYGDGNIVETQLIGTKQEPQVHVREVPLEALYPTVGPLDAATSGGKAELKMME